MELEDGKYRARGVKAELGFTQGGKEQVGVELELTGEGFQGKRLSWFGYFTDAALPITLKALEALGWKGDDLSDLSTVNANEVELVVENEEYNGKVRPKVQFINPIGGLSMKEPMAPDAAKTFAARMKGKILGARQAAGQRAPVRSVPPPSRAAPADDFNDDIPF